MKWIVILFLALSLPTEAQITIHGRRGVVLTGDTVIYSHIYNVGTGSGDLTIDGNATSYLDNSIILIASGTYGTINIQNLNPTTKITIRNSGGTVLMDGMNRVGLTPNIYAGYNFTNCSNILWTGDGKSGTTYGFKIVDQSYRPTTLSGFNKNITTQWTSYDNVGDQCITLANSSNIVWDGTDNTVVDYNCKFLNLKFSNFAGGQPFSIGGFMTTMATTDLMKLLEIGSSIFDTCNSGDMIYGGAVQQYYIHNNQFLNCNLTNNNDNGMSHIIGCGDFVNNYMSNCQGHAVRFWSISWGATPITCHAYNNIYISSRKYSPFEWQSTTVASPNSNFPPGPNTTYCNFIIANNTGGNLNYEDHTEFDACLIDNYGLAPGSSTLVVNNLLYNTFTSNGAPGRMFQFPPGSDPQYTIITNNYETNATAAVFNETTLVLGALSPEKNAGTPGYLQTLYDYHGLPWNTLTPSIGAVQ